MTPQEYLMIRTGAKSAEIYSDEFHFVFDDNSGMRVQLDWNLDRVVEKVNAIMRSVGLANNPERDNKSHIPDKTQKSY